MESQTRLKLVVIAALAFSAGAAYASSPMREIQSDYRQFTAAETSGQYARIKQVTNSFFAPDFALITGKNKLTYPQFLAEMKDTINEDRTIRENAFRPMTVKKTGDTLLEGGVYTFTRTAVDPDGEYGAKGLVHRIADKFNYRSIWIRSGSGWRLQSMQFVGRREVVDGKLQA